MALAYVFWHRPAAGQDPGRYEAALLRFLDRLRAVPVPGLLAAGTLRVPHLPWLARGGWEDWYVVADFAALGTLNAAAVDPDRRAPHDEVAHRAGPGYGAVYGQLAGPAGIPGGSAPHQVAWFDKPAGVGCPAFTADLTGPAPAAALWQRQMVLGPAPEFRLAGAALPFAALPTATTIGPAVPLPA